jgi:tripartite-type tricarboxylate transporter receptor subunit TctC
VVWHGRPQEHAGGDHRQIEPEINAGLADPRMKARLAEIGGEPLTGSASEFGTFIAEETVKWAKVVKFAGMKPE